MFQKKISKERLRDLKKQLKGLYSSIPETQGCAEHIGNCRAWCCEVQNPQFLYVEFLNVWDHVQNTTSYDTFIEFIAKCMRTYMDTSITKGCVLFDSVSRKCTCHSVRPFNCRMYGQIPRDEFQSRYEKLKVLYPDVDYRNQCDLVKTVGAPVTKAESDRWFKELNEIEAKAVVDKKMIHDNEGGSYRTFFDHVLLKLFPPDLLYEMTGWRTHGTPEQKERFVQKIIEKMRKARGQESQDTKGEGT